MLAANYPPRAQSEDSAVALATAWWITLESETHWLTIDIYDQAIKVTLRTVKDYLPPVGAFLDTCREESRRQRNQPSVAIGSLPSPLSRPPSEEELAAAANARKRLEAMGILRIGRPMPTTTVQGKGATQ